MHPHANASVTDRTGARWHRLERWERASAPLMFAVALAFFAASSAILIDVQLEAETRATLTTIVSATWLLFIVEFVLRLVMSPRKLTFLRTRWFDLVSVFIPVLRPFLIVTYLWRLPFFRSTDPRRRRTRNVLAVSIASLLYIYTASLGVYLVEHNAPGATIVSMGDALWWGFTTISTVGYGDFTPVTILGRVLAVTLMVSGVLIVGFVSATIMNALREDAQTIAARLHVREHGGPHEEDTQRIN